MRRLLALLMVLGFVGALPSAAAEEPSFAQITRDVESFGRIDVEVASKYISVAWTGIRLGGNVSNFLREQVDGLSGEPDGEVSEEEADAAVVLIKEFVSREFERYSHDRAYSGLLLIDTTSSSGAEVTQLITDGVTGPVDSNESIGLGFTARIGFPTRPSDVHTVKLDLGRYYFREVNESRAEETVREFTLTIRGAGAWSIDAASIQPACAADNFDEESGTMTFTTSDVNCFTGRPGVLLGFSIVGQDDEDDFNIPGFEFLFLVGGFLAVALLRRRR